ncbi:hypothetical protein FNJ84_05745 [Paracoccus sp. M683]|uniref:hypothetical protein n=1 Tax=Paracoccus sp. M683 TaxID=2594268 RepID=UPI00117FBDDF|nr:hypothetical protein [Paracoccus sp. M683]TRW98281.1 hypothetical protein FNJ84_05745 [Paracoccus sp. M683]
MFKPALTQNVLAGAADRPAASDYFYLEGRTIATPVFRILLWCDGHWRDRANRQAMLGVFDLFCLRWSGQFHSLTRASADQPPRTCPNTDASLAALRAELAAGTARMDSGIRLAGWTDSPHFIESAPCLRLGELGDLAFLALELPPDADDLVDFTDQVTEFASAMSLRCGVAGFGYFLPDYLESLVFALPMAMARTNAAIEVTPRCVAFCIMPQALATQDVDEDPPVAVGLADIGWRTLIGAGFRDRLPDLSMLAKGGDVAVDRRGELVVVTAGDRPVWGRVLPQEDIAPYQRVAKALGPLRISPRLAQRHLFGGDNGDPERNDRVQAYLNRLDD